MTPTAIYRAIMLAVDERRQALGWPMWMLDDKAGIADRLYAKLLHADAKSGRQAQWATLQDICDALYPDGFEVLILAKKGQTPADVETFKRKLQHIAATFNAKSRRELMAEIGRRASPEARRMGRLKIPRSRRKAIAKQAALVRWQRKRNALDKQDA